MDQLLAEILGGNIVILLFALFIILSIFLAIRIVPQSEQHVVERFGRLRVVLGPGINFIVPFLDRVAHRVSILERQLPTASQDAITTDNVLLVVETSVFYRVLHPERTVYRIRDVDAAIATTVAGIVRAHAGAREIARQVAERRAHQAQLYNRIQTARNAGMSDRQIRDAFRNTGVSGSELNRIMRNEFVPIDISRGLIREVNRETNVLNENRILQRLPTPRFVWSQMMSWRSLIAYARSMSASAVALLICFSNTSS